MPSTEFMTPGEKMSHVSAVTLTPGWDILLARFRRNRETVLGQLLDGATSDAETLALKRAYVFMVENDPQKLAESLIREFRGKDKSAAGLNPTA